MQRRRAEGTHPAGEIQSQPFQLSFNSSLKIDFQGSRATSDGGLILVGELKEGLGIGDQIDQHVANRRQVRTHSSPWRTCCGSRPTAAWLAMKT